jgi:two-component system response regulator
VEALDYLFATGEHTERDADDMPAVILLDINLPRLDGHEVLRQTRPDDRTKLLPVVMLTSSDDDEDKIAAYTAVANSYVRKPVDFSEFIVAVQRLGLYWLLLNSGPPKRK